MSAPTLAPPPAHPEGVTGAADRPAAGLPPTVTVLIPAHDEGAQIAETLAGLRRQTLPPTRVVVVADNCSDDTAELARRLGAEVYETVANQDKKAGGLNQAIGQRFRRSGEDRRGAARSGVGAGGPERRVQARCGAGVPDLRDEDYVLVMDADTVLSDDFLAAAVAALDADPRVGAAGGLFYGQPGGGVLGQLQRNEYERYSREVGRTRRVMVLTGTGTLFRVAAIREVAAARGAALPGAQGHVYDTLALTEDNELTLALKTLGWRLTSPAACRVTTEIMPTWGDLWRQRMRWQRGALENLRHYGLTRVTARYWGQQLGIGLGVVAFQLYLALTALLLLTAHSLTLSPFWTGVGGIFLLERLVTVWRGGWRARLVALPLLIEMAYDLFIQAVFVRSLLDVVTGREATWHHVTAAPAGAGSR
jgi:biofilm PGA synthesis N-glycosyltransferase PgaC